MVYKVHQVLRRETCGDTGSSARMMMITIYKSLSSDSLDQNLLHYFYFIRNKLYYQPSMIQLLNKVIANYEYKL